MTDKNLPTRAGWYWAWVDADGPDIVSISENGRGKLRAQLMGVRGDHAIWDLPVTRWLGPLAPGLAEQNDLEA